MMKCIGHGRRAIIRGTGSKIAQTHGQLAGAFVKERCWALAVSRRKEILTHPKGAASLLGEGELKLKPEGGVGVRPGADAIIFRAGKSVCKDLGLEGVESRARPVFLPSNQSLRLGSSPPSLGWIVDPPAFTLFSFLPVSPAPVHILGCLL